MLFLSYQFRERATAEELAALVAVSNGSLDAYDQRVRMQASSPEAEAAKASIRDQIEAAAALVCIVGPTTATSSWVDWEISCALSLARPVYLMAMDDGAPLPAQLASAAAERLPPSAAAAAAVLASR